MTTSGSQSTSPVVALPKCPAGIHVLDYVYSERSEIQETGEYDVEGWFVRLHHAIDSIGAKRVVLDTLEALFAGLPITSLGLDHRLPACALTTRSRKWSCGARTSRWGRGRVC
jgi:hypothetical protein